MQVSGLYIYPVKSLRGTRVDTARVMDRGFEGDRRFMVVRPDGEFVTQRTAPVLGRITARIGGDTLHLEHGERGVASLPTQPPGGDTLEVEVWGSRVTAERVDAGGGGVDGWLSEIVGEPVHLVVMPETTRRAVDPTYDRGNDIVSFADGYPYLVIGDSSLDDLNTRMAQSVTMERFRPNMTVSGTPPFAEDGWGTVRFGDVSFEAVKPCERCVVTTLDPDTGEQGKEPLATLATFRKVGGGVMMGMNLVPTRLSGDLPGGGGVLHVGDPVVPLANGGNQS